MQAPDKLYLSPVIYGTITNLSPDPDCEGEVEYIRKDALIEWANKKLQDTADRLDFHGNQAFIELYSKINSM